MEVKRPNVIIYFLAYILIYPLLKLFFKLEVDRKNLVFPEGPYIMLSNHDTMIDFVVAMLPLYTRRINAVTAQKFFLYRPLHKLLPMMGCIPKNMFSPDIRSIVGIKTVLKRGDGILMFPEGRCTSGHAYTGIHKATGKMIKKFGVPVISCYIEGASVCVPHWRKGIRFGHIRVTYRNLFSEEDLKSLTIDEINAAIDARLSGQEGVSPPKKPFKALTTRRLAEGLHNILYWCPKCGSEYTMKTKSNAIFCTACGNRATLDRNTKLIPAPDSVFPDDRISSWFREQVRNEMRALSADMEPIVDKVTVRTPSSIPGGGIIESGSGIMRLDPTGWHFEGELSGEQVTLFFPVESVPALSYDHNDCYQLNSGNSLYRFAPEDRRKSFKYAILGECMHWKFSPRALMTPGVNSGFVEG